jgi:hypothetical protein
MNFWGLSPSAATIATGPQLDPVEIALPNTRTRLAQKMGDVAILSRSKDV